jgi:hypothetical protein
MGVNVKRETLCKSAGARDFIKLRKVYEVNAVIFEISRRLSTLTFEGLAPEKFRLCYKLLQRGISLNIN